MKTPYKIMKNEKTSKFVASEASDILRSKKASDEAKSVAGSALTQAPDKKKSGTNSHQTMKKSGGCM